MSTLATEVSRLTPQAKTILRHLRNYGNISPMECMVAYGTHRLARAIHELRVAGYDIVTQIKKDAVGHRYARYSLIEARH